MALAPRCALPQLLGTEPPESMSLCDLSPGVPSGARAPRLGHPLPGFSCLVSGELTAPLMAWEEGWVPRSSMNSSVFPELVSTALTTPSGTRLG